MVNNPNNHIENIARLFHARYEIQSNLLGWNTQSNCKVPFDELPESNKNVMIATVRDVLALGLLVDLSNVKDVLEGIIEDETLYNEIEIELNELHDKYIS